MAATTPNELVAAHTADFVARQLPDAGAHILDVGCGTGEVAAALTERGYRVSGIDVVGESVEAARARGVDAHLTSIHDFAGGPFDAVLFAYSLHHIERPVAALERAIAMLAPGGRVLLLEIAFHEMDAQSLAWVRSMDALVLATGLIEESCVGYFEVDDEHGHHHDHEEHVHHPSDQVRGFIEERLRIVSEERAPLVYGFWADQLPADQAALCGHLYQLERLATEAGALVSLSARWVAVPAR